MTEIRKFTRKFTFCSKNLVHKGVNFEAKNALNLTYEHLQFQKKIPGVRGLYPRNFFFEIKGARR